MECALACRSLDGLWAQVGAESRSSSRVSRLLRSACLGDVERTTPDPSFTKVGKFEVTRRNAVGPVLAKVEMSLYIGRVDGLLIGVIDLFIYAYVVGNALNMQVLSFKPD